jgi:hypothetical protein
MIVDCPGVATASPQLSRQCIPPTSSSGSSSSDTTHTTTIVTTAASGSEPVIRPTAATSGEVSPGSTNPDAPILSNVEATSLDTTTEKITWTTNEPSDSQVEYGVEDGVQRFTPNDSRLTTDHVVWLSNLEPGTEYVYRAFSRDASGNEGRSAEQRFSTPILSLASAAAAFGGMNLSGCCWLSILLFILLVIASLLAAHWHGKAQRPMPSKK